MYTVIYHSCYFGLCKNRFLHLLWSMFNYCSFVFQIGELWCTTWLCGFRRLYIQGESLANHLLVPYFFQRKSHPPLELWSKAKLTRGLWTNVCASSWNAYICWSSQSLWLLWALTQSWMLPNSIRKNTQHHQMPMGINGSKSHIWYNVGPPSYKLVYNPR